MGDDSHQATELCPTDTQQKKKMLAKLNET